MTRLARNVRANTLIIVAFALIPLCGMIGGGLDLSRMYLVKTRLQHACDAGALAGRKAMGGGTWTQQNNLPRSQAERFFDANIDTDAYGSNTITRSFTENAGKVSGTASAQLPMTLMRVLGMSTQTLAVACATEMRLPNTDVMFVLDTTGSMNCVAGDTSCINNGGVPATGSKIDGLKVAVKCFYEIVARLDTDANCDGGAPSGGTGNQVQIRFGFVPYASNVNVGKLLPTSFIADKWSYQTRTQALGTSWSDWMPYSNWCSRPRDTLTTQYRWQTSTGSCVEYRTFGANWRYALQEVNIGGLKNGTTWRSSFTVPGVNDDRSNKTISWDGCIEERKTVRATNYDPIPSDANDLNIDLVPSAGVAGTQWGPALPGLIWARNVVWSWDQLSYPEVTTSTNYYNSVPYECPTESKLLQTWPSADTFDDYVDSLSASGATYHDIGMIWGARLLSPTGIFRAQNEFTPQGGEIERHMIFMTDGDTSTGYNNYYAYGLPWLDRRQTNVNAAPTNDDLNAQVNARFSAVCTVVKNKNITLWVVSFGGDVNATTEARLAACASPGRYFKADDSAALQRTFRSIADQISALRLIQ